MCAMCVIISKGRSLEIGCLVTKNAWLLDDGIKYRLKINSCVCTFNVFSTTYC